MELLKKRTEYSATLHFSALTLYISPFRIMVFQNP